MTSIVLLILKCIFVKTSSSERNHTFYVITDYTTWLVKSKRIQQGWKSKEMAECCKFYTLQQNPIISGHPFLTTYSAISLSAHANDNLYFLSDSEWVLIKKHWILCLPQSVFTPLCLYSYQANKITLLWAWWLHEHLNENVCAAYRRRCVGNVSARLGDPRL